MVACNIFICPKCGGSLKFYDKVWRIIRTKGRAAKYIKIRRLMRLRKGC